MVDFFVDFLVTLVFILALVYAIKGFRKRRINDD